MTFIVYALPRSRTSWLSRFLTYGDWQCGHDEIRHLRSMDDARSWFAQPNTGTVETAAAPWWRLARQICPEARVVVVRRPVGDVVDSLMRLGGWWERERLAALMHRLDRKLDQIVARTPDALSVRFDELADEAACKRVFEFCLPYTHDPNWWQMMAPLNLQADMRLMLRYYQAYRPQIEKLVSIAKHESLSLIYGAPAPIPDDVTIEEVPFAAYYPGALDLIRDHSVVVGEAPEYTDDMNFPLMGALHQEGRLQIVMARSNGRTFGYLASRIEPAFIDKNVKSAYHTSFYADPEMPGVGRRMVRFANGLLSEKGVGEVFFRAGMRGDGPRLGKLWQRFGAEQCGQLYRLDLRTTQT